MTFSRAWIRSLKILGSDSDRVNLGPFSVDNRGDRVLFLGLTGDLIKDTFLSNENKEHTTNYLP